MTKFYGFDLTTRAPQTRQFTCRGCSNVCRINEVRFGCERPFYHGARCDRYEVHDLDLNNGIPDLFRRREQVLFNFDGQCESREAQRYPAHTATRGRVGIPRSLLAWDSFPFFSAYFRTLGYEVVLSPLTHQGLVRSSVESSPAAACLPVKVVHGHVEALLKEGVDFMFIPALVDAAHPNTTTRTNYNCPLIQAQPYILSSQFDWDSLGVTAISDAFHFYHEERVRGELTRLAKRLGASPRLAKQALQEAWEAERESLAQLRMLSDEAMALVKEGATGVVVLSRSYNSGDHGLSLGVPDKLRSLGAVAIPVDCVPWEEINVDPNYPFMQWNAGKRMLAAAEVVRRSDLWALHLSHFNCGPDSFIAHYLREALRGKPFLSLELDEHSGDAGVMTRLEAYLDSVGSRDRKPTPGPPRALSNPKTAFDSTKKVYLPYMCDTNYAIAASFRHFGVQAETLPPPDAESMSLGRKCSSGGECLPFILTTGDFVKLTAREDFDPARSALFMATSTGPCRFCHYFAAQRLVLERKGCTVDFISLEAYGGYTIQDLGSKFRRTAWYGMVVVDLLQKLLWRTRPYEAVPGTTAAVYDKTLREVQDAIVQGGIKGLLSSLPGVVAQFKAIELQQKFLPRIGIVGEIYVRANPFSNANLAQLVEELGGEARVSPISEWMNYVMYNKQQDGWIRRDWRSYTKARLERYVLHRDEQKVSQPFRGALGDWELEEPSADELLRASAPFISSAYRGEPVLTVGKAIDYAHAGFDGIINVMPFSCMPGTIVAAVSDRVKHQYHIPWLNLTFDGQEQAHLRTRLEAFLHQAKLHRKSRARPKGDKGLLDGSSDGGGSPLGDGGGGGD